MTRNVTIGEAKTHFSSLVRRAEAGEEIVVRRGRDPVARIVPLAKQGGVRGFGSMKGKIHIAPDLDKADAEIQRMFEESEIFPGEDSSADRD
jgi:prevent-host-death family protein